MKKILKWILVALSVLVMVFIFIMSSQPARESTNESREIGRIIGQLIFRDFREWTSADQLSFTKAINHTVRKLAHFVEFAVLGSVFLLTLTAWDMKRRPALPVSFGAGLLYALTDEFHQLFVEGRSAEFGDVMLDAAGVAFGCLIVWIILTVISKRRAKKAKTGAPAAGT